MPTSCNNCRQAKVKCDKKDDEKPCSRCERLGKNASKLILKENKKKRDLKTIKGVIEINCV